MADVKKAAAKTAKKKGKTPRKANVEHAETMDVELEVAETPSSEDSHRPVAQGPLTQEEIEDRRANGGAAPARDYEEDTDLDNDDAPNFNAREGRDSRDNRNNRSDERPQRPAPVAPAVTRPKAGDDYTIAVAFDRNSKQFVAAIVEFPELKATAGDRERAVKEAERKLENHVQELKRRGTQITDALAVKQYPERLEIPVSQTLFRKLDHLSRHEKVGMDQLVAEILSAGVEKRFEPPQKSGGQPQREQQHHRHERHENRSHQHSHRDGNQRHQGNRDHRRGGGGHGRRDYNNTMENRESFLEYVRSLEKNGGYGRKK